MVSAVPMLLTSSKVSPVPFARPAGGLASPFGLLTTFQTSDPPTTPITAPPVCTGQLPLPNPLPVNCTLNAMLVGAANTVNVTGVLLLAPAESEANSA